VPYAIESMVVRGRMIKYGTSIERMIAGGIRNEYSSGRSSASGASVMGTMRHKEVDQNAQINNVYIVTDSKHSRRLLHSCISPPPYVTDLRKPTNYTVPPAIGT
jgi:hypothetical protein